MLASLPAASACVHHEGANLSRTIGPSAAIAVAVRGSACSQHPYCNVDRTAASRRGSSICSNQNDGPTVRIDEVRLGLSRRGSYPNTLLAEPDKPGAEELPAHIRALGANVVCATRSMTRTPSSGQARPVRGTDKMPEHSLRPGRRRWW